MRLLNCTVKNFGSYKRLEFDFQKEGLALVHGPTGSGKSTLCDIAPWILFGVTAKGGAVDDIRHWQSGGEATEGVLLVDNLGLLTVTRTRGKSSSQNDLYWVEHTNPNKKERGKDVTETQRLLERRLGISADLYLLAAYCHEFSSTGQFFTAKAKDRRSFFEQVAPLEFPALLATVSGERKKEVKKSLQVQEQEQIRLKSKIDTLLGQLLDTDTAILGWQATYDLQLAQLIYSRDNFESERLDTIERLEIKEAWLTNKIAAVCENIKLEIDRKSSEMNHCPTCASPLYTIEEQENIDNLRAQYEVECNRENTYTGELADWKQLENIYIDRIAILEQQINPHVATRNKIGSDITDGLQKEKELNNKIDALTTCAGQYDLLQELAVVLRGELLHNTIKQIESDTNRCLEQHFDAEIRVSFQVGDTDNLLVEIQKNGYVCPYTQLSKGQRGLLKLAFSLGVMKAAANKSGIHFDNLFMDESLDGLDADLKVRAFGVFEQMSQDHTSIFVIEHASEFKNLFPVKYKVSLQEDCSILEEE